MNEYLGSCKDLLDRFKSSSIVSCCDSCHDDIDSGYEGIDVEFEDGFYKVCCNLKNHLEDKNLI